MNDKLDRRSFIEFAALGLSAFATGTPLRWMDPRGLPSFGLRELKAVSFVRAEIHSAGGQAMIPALRAGVAAMRTRSAADENDPTGWNYQWKMHGTHDPTTKLAWKTCQHGNFLFVTWHRIYLYYFERILRKASADPTFALPYWDYEPATQRQLPSAFWENPTTNSLYFDSRGDHMNDGTAEINATNGSPLWALAAAHFNGSEPTGFGGGVVTQPVHFDQQFGRLESVPHNVVHDNIGGDMGDPDTAANDPIFWLHHANIDRLWSLWKALDTSNHKDPTANSVWMNTLFTFFDENGTTVHMKGGDVLDSAGQLGYRYDTEPAFTPDQLAAFRAMLRRRPFPFPFQFDFRFFRRPIPWPPEPPVPGRETMALGNQRLVINSVETVTTLPVSKGTVAGLRSALAQPSHSAPLILALEGLSVRRPPGGRIDVFVLRGRQSVASAMKLAAETAARVYAGTLDFFSIFGEFGTTDGVRNAVLGVDVSDSIRTDLSRLSANGDTLTVLFQFRGATLTKEKTLVPPGHPISIDRIRLYVAAPTK